MSRGTNRGRGRGRGCGWGTGQTQETQERTAASGNQDGNDGNQVQDNGGQYFGPMVPMEVEDEFLKTKVPTMVMYHNPSSSVRQRSAIIAGMQKIWSPPTTCYSGCIASEWGGIQKKYYRQSSYQMPIFAFVIWIAYRSLSLVLSTNTCTWAITIFRV